MDATQEIFQMSGDEMDARINAFVNSVNGGARLRNGKAMTFEDVEKIICGWVKSGFLTENGKIYMITWIQHGLGIN